MVCRELVFQSKDAKEADQLVLMEQSFHGTKVADSQLDLFLAGDDGCQWCHTEAPIQNNSEGNEGCADTGCLLQLE